MFNTIKPILFLLFVLLFSNCDKQEDVLFKMEYEQDFEIPAGLNIFSVWCVNLQDVNTNIDGYLTSFNRTEGEINDIEPGNARLSTIFSSVEYDFIQNVSIRMYRDNPDSYKEIYYRDNVPFNTKSDLDLLPSLSNLKDWMLEDQFNLTACFRFREAPPQFVESRLKFEFLAK